MFGKSLPLEASISLSRKLRLIVELASQGTCETQMNYCHEFLNIMSAIITYVTDGGY